MTLQKTAHAPNAELTLQFFHKIIPFAQQFDHFAPLATTLTQKTLRVHVAKGDCCVPRPLV